MGVTKGDMSTDKSLVDQQLSQDALRDELQHFARGVLDQQLSAFAATIIGETRQILVHELDSYCKQSREPRGNVSTGLPAQVLTNKTNPECQMIMETPDAKFGVAQTAASGFIVD